jgi:hypothetical protein
MFSNQCGQSIDTSDKNSTSPAAQDAITITYVAQSRGFYEKIWVDASGISFVDNRELNNVMTKPISTGDWEELLALKNTLNLETLPILKAPSEKRFSDGAAIGSLTIKTEQAEVKSSEFDHGYPPKEIETMVNKLLSIKEKILKQ